jgi:4-hydroxy-tetrahydrodipicolinate synthase
MVGVGDTGTGRARRNLRRATTSVDFVAACTPYYYPAPDEAALTRHFADLADASAVPLVLYNIPQNTHQPIGWNVVTELAGHDNVVGIKDSSGDTDYFRRLVTLSRPDFTVLQGTQERRAAEFLRMGADGFVSGLENVIPGALQDLVRAAGDGEDDALHWAEQRIETAFEILSQGFWLSALKVATGMLVGGGDRPAAPLPPLSPEHRAAIREILGDLGLLPVS